MPPDCRTGDPGPDGDRPATFLAREDVDDGREGGRHDQRSADPHHRAPDDQLLTRLRECRSETGDPEDHQARLQRQISTEAIAKRAHGQQQPGEDEDVGIDHPLQLRTGG
jgi:hypothetical protein